MKVSKVIKKALNAAGPYFTEYFFIINVFSNVCIEPMEDKI